LQRAVNSLGVGLIPASVLSAKSTFQASGALVIRFEFETNF